MRREVENFHLVLPLSSEGWCSNVSVEFSAIEMDMPLKIFLVCLQEYEKFD